MLSEELAWAGAGCAPPPSAPHLPQVRHRLPAPGLSGPVRACLLRVQPRGRLSSPRQPSPAALPSPQRAAAWRSFWSPRGSLSALGLVTPLLPLGFVLLPPLTRCPPEAPAPRRPARTRRPGPDPGSQLQAARSRPPHLLPPRPPAPPAARPGLPDAGRSPQRGWRGPKRGGIPPETSAPSGRLAPSFQPFLPPVPPEGSFPARPARAPAPDPALISPPQGQGALAGSC